MSRALAQVAAIYRRGRDSVKDAAVAPGSRSLQAPSRRRGQAALALGAPVPAASRRRNRGGLRGVRIAVALRAVPIAGTRLMRAVDGPHLALP